MTIPDQLAETDTSYHPDTLLTPEEYHQMILAEESVHALAIMEEKMFRHCELVRANETGTGIAGNNSEKKN